MVAQTSAVGEVVVLARLEVEVILVATTLCHALVNTADWLGIVVGKLYGGDDVIKFVVEFVMFNGMHGAPVHK